MSARRVLATVATLGAVLALTACSGSTKPGRTVTKIVAPPSSAPASTPVSSSPPVPPPLTTPAAMSKLPGRCDGELKLELVGATIGETLPGLTDFVVGTADPSIKRVSYINCRYGLADQNSTPTVEIQVSLYGTSAEAAARIAPTVSDYGDNGATAKKTTVGGAPATILTGGTGADYSSATLVMAFGQRTVAVSVSDDIDSAKRAPDLLELALLAVKRTQ